MSVYISWIYSLPLWININRHTHTCAQLHCVLRSLGVRWQILRMPGPKLSPLLHQKHPAFLLRLRLCSLFTGSSGKLVGANALLFTRTLKHYILLQRLWEAMENCPVSSILKNKRYSSYYSYHIFAMIKLTHCSVAVCCAKNKDMEKI